MSDWNEESAKHKAMKRGIVDQRPVPNHKKKKVDKPWHVLWLPSWKTKENKPYVIGRFATRDLAEAYIEKQRRSIYASRQNQSERAWEEARARVEERVKRYSIQGPE